MECHLHLKYLVCHIYKCKLLQHPISAVLCIHEYMWDVCRRVGHRNLGRSQQNIDSERVYFVAKYVVYVLLWSVGEHMLIGM